MQFHRLVIRRLTRLLWRLERKGFLTCPARGRSLSVASEDCHLKGPGTLFSVVWPRCSTEAMLAWAICEGRVRKDAELVSLVCHDKSKSSEISFVRRVAFSSGVFPMDQGCCLVNTFIQPCSSVSGAAELLRSKEQCFRYNEHGSTCHRTWPSHCRCQGSFLLLMFRPDLARRPCRDVCVERLCDFGLCRCRRLKVSNRG